MEKDDLFILIYAKLEEFELQHYKTNLTSKINEPRFQHGANISQLLGTFNGQINT